MAYRSLCRHLLAASALLAFLPAAARAQAPAETVVVTGLEAAIPQILSQDGAQVDTISSTQIKNSGALDVSQALAQAPGLFISSQHGPFDYVDVSLLGSRTADVLWAVDGVRINNRLYAGTTPLDSIPAAIIDHIEVVQGGESLFYGTQAAAGVINIVTKDFSRDFDGAATLSGDSNYGAHADAFVRGALGGGEFVAYASADMGRGFRPIPENEFQPSETLRQRGYQVFSGGGKYRYAFTDALTFTASYEKNLGHLEYPQAEDVFNAYNQRSEDLVTAKLDYTPSDAFQLFVKGYYHWWISHYTEFDNDPAGGLDVIDDHDHWGYVDRGVNAMARVKLMDGLASTLGYDYQNYNGNDAVLVIAPRSEQVHAVFGELDAEPLPNAHLALGGRYNMPSVGESAFVWSASARYDISDMLYVKATGGTNFRLPTAEELFANDPDDERGNPNLRPERSSSVNASLGGDLALTSMPVSWHATVFYREIKDLIDYDTFDAVTDQDVFGNVAGNVITQGVEIYASVPFSDALSANADFTYAAARQTGSKLQFNRIPETQFKLGLDWHPADQPFGGSLTLQNVGNLADTIGGGVGRVDYGNYTVLNLGTRLFLDDAHQHRIGLNIDNLTDEGYASHLARGTSDATGNSYLVHERGQPRTFYLSYTYAFH